MSKLALISMAIASSRELSSSSVLFFLIVSIALKISCKKDTTNPQKSKMMDKIATVMIVLCLIGLAINLFEFMI